MFKPQRSFASGEIAPELHSRSDTTKYQQAAKTCKNFIVQKFGGVTRRTGTLFVGETSITNDTRVRNIHGPPRLIPWNAGSGSGYVLEFGHRRMRVIKNGSYITTPGAWEAIDSISTSGVVTLNANRAGPRASLKGGKALVRLRGLWNHAPELHNNVYRASNYVVGANPTVTLLDLDGSAITNTAVTGAGWIEVIFEMETPISLGSARKMRHSISENKITLSHKDLPVLEVSKGTGDSDWTISSPYGTDGNIKVVSRKDGKNVSLLPPPASSLSTDAFRERSPEAVDKEKPWKRYCVTTVDGTGRESLPRYTNYIQKNDTDSDTYSGFIATVAATGFSGADYRVTSSSTLVSLDFDDARGPNDGYSGTRIKFSSAGTVGLKGDVKFTVRGKDYYGSDVTETVSMTSFEGDGDAETAFEEAEMYTVNYFRSIESITANREMGDGPDVGGLFKIGLADWDWDNVQLSWTRAPDIAGVSALEHYDPPVTYRVYRSDGGLFGLIGVMTSNEADDGTIRFTDSDRTPDYTETPPVVYTPFPDRALDKAYKYELSPNAVCHYQQRRIFGGSDRYSSRVWASGIGDSGNFNTKHILTAKDPFYFDIAADKMQNILHALSLNKIVIFTDSGEWVLEGDDTGAISPTSINARQISHMGSGDLEPVMVDNDALFYQPRGSTIRDLGYTAQGYNQSSDLTLYAYHLFDGYRITSWAYQRSPDSVLWCVRSDGLLLSLTYIKEQKIVAWTKHIIGGNGAVVDVCTVPEGGDDAVYLVVRRDNFAGDEDKSRYYVERLSTRPVIDLRAGIYTDSAVKQNGWRTRGSQGGTMELSISGVTGGSWSDGGFVKVTLSNPWFDETTTYDTPTKYQYLQTNDINNALLYEEYTKEGTFMGKEWVDLSDSELNKYMEVADNSEFYRRLINTPGALSGKKIVVSKGEDDIPARPGSKGQILRPCHPRHPYTTGGGRTGIANLEIVKVNSRTEAIAKVRGSAGIPASVRSTPIESWSFAEVLIRDDGVSVATGTDFNIGSTVTVTATAANFVPPYNNTSVDVGDQIHIGDPDTPSTNCIITITSVTSGLVVVGTVSQAAVPAYARNQTTYRWGRARKFLYGLNHLRGENISVFADGRIESSPYNSDEATLTVSSSGSVELATPAVVMSGGLPYVSDLETLEIDQVGAEALGDKSARVAKVNVDVKDTISGHAGPYKPASNTALTDMVPLWLQQPGESPAATDFRTGKFTTTAIADWGKRGSFIIRNVDPTPMTILAAHPDIQVTRRGK